MLMVMPISFFTRSFIFIASCLAGPNSLLVPVMSSDASSMETWCIWGAYSRRMDMTSLETRLYLCMSPPMKIPSGQRRLAWRVGIALWTPKTRASYEHVETTQRGAT